MPSDWQRYLHTYHQQHPGITETLLDRALGANGATPYQDLLNQLPIGPIDILDVGCGSAPMVPSLTRCGYYLGLDQSLPELTVASTNHPTAWFTAGNALALPLADGAFDVVVASMSLMLLQPLPDAVAEISRVLRPTGSLTAIYPGPGWPRIRELPQVAVILAGLLRPPEVPQTLTRHRLDQVFQDAGMRLAVHETRRYSIPADTPEHADQIIDGLYLPNVPLHRIERARSLLRQLARPGAAVPLNIAHSTAIKEPAR